MLEEIETQFSGSKALITSVVKEVGRELPASIVVGKTYAIVENNVITSAKIEKIYTDVYNLMYVMFTKPIKGKFQKRMTVSMTVSDFKVRVLVGGVNSIEL